jgi:NAD(P)H-nitrite reductase large subunit
VKRKPVTICRCQEVIREEIEAAIEQGYLTMAGVKRQTSAGTGLCQGRTCEHLIRQMLCQATGLEPASVGRNTVRPPLEPIAVHVLLREQEGSD